MPYKNGNADEPPIPLPDPSPVGLEPRPLSSPDTQVLTRLLRMADSYRDGGGLRQALEIYWELVERHGDTPVGELARGRLLGICEQYEREGKFHQARAMYERLL